MTTTSPTTTTAVTTSTTTNIVCSDVLAVRGVAVGVAGVLVVAGAVGVAAILGVAGVVGVAGVWLGVAGGGGGGRAVGCEVLGDESFVHALGIEEAVRCVCAGMKVQATCGSDSLHVEDP